MAKTVNSKARAASIFASWKSNPNGVSSSDLSYLRKYLRQDTEYAQQLQSDYNFNVSLFTSGSVKNAKDYYNTYLFTPTPSRGKNGQDTASMIMRSGMRTNQTSPVSDVTIEKSNVGNRKDYMSATPEGGRTRTDGEVQSIIRRGRQGATLNLEDQRIYDRYVTMQREEANREASERARKEADKQKAKERAAKFQQLGMKDDDTLNDAQIQELLDKRAAKIKSDQEYADWERKQQYQAKQSALEAQAKAQADADKAALARRQKETDNGRTPDMTDEDYAKFMQFGGPKFAKWGYSAEDEAEIEGQRRVIQNAINQGILDDDEIKRLKDGLEERIANGRWKKQVTLRDNMPEGQPVISDDGQFYVSDGKWTPLTQHESAEDKRKNALQDRKDKWIDDKAQAYQKDGIYEKGSDGKPVFRELSYPEALKLARRDAAERFKDETEDGGVDPNLFGGDNADVCSLCGSPLDGEGVCTNPDCDHYREYHGDQTVMVDEPDIVESQTQGHVKASYL